MQMGLIPREPALKPLSTGLVKFPNCFSACVSSAWAHEPRAFLYGYDSVFLRNGMVSAPHVLQRSRALTSSKCTQPLTSVPHASTLLNTSSQTPQLHHLVEYQGLASAPGPPHYFDVTLRWHCHLCCCRNSHGISGGITLGGTSWPGLAVIIHFLFHVDFGATSDRENKTGFGVRISAF